jgi:membrane protein implicated in regulation of membrane protease activity
LKITLQVLIAITLIIALTWIVSALMGYLMFAAIVTVVALAVAAVIRLWLDARKATKKPVTHSDRRAERDAEKMLHKLERKSAAERSKE